MTGSPGGGGIGSKFRQPIAYVAVGAWNTIFGFGLFALAYKVLGSAVNYMLLLGACNILAITNAYICYKVFVFRTRGNWPKEYGRFLAVYGLATAIGMAGIGALVQGFHLHPVAANAIVTIGTIVISYVGHKRFSFSA
jgi:putative flippase GtrA